MGRLQEQSLRLDAEYEDIIVDIVQTNHPEAYQKPIGSAVWPCKLVQFNASTAGGISSRSCSTSELDKDGARDIYFRSILL